MPELIKTADEAEWLAARRQGVTASEIAVLLGISPYSSPYALYHQKRGTIDAPEQDDAMQLGSYMEQFVADRFAERYPDLIVTGDGRGLYRHSDRPWQMATPDRVIGVVAWTDRCTCGTGPGGYYGMHERHCGQELEGPEAVLETKIDGGSDEWGEEGTDEIPVHYRAQVLWQMDVMGVDRAYVAAFIWHRRRVQVYELTLDDEARADLELMRKEARAFLDCMEAGIEPDVDWRPSTIDALKTLNPLVGDEETAVVGVQLRARYRAAVKNHKYWEQRKKLYEAQLRQQMGSARRAVSESGVPVCRRDVYGVKESVRKAYTVDKIVPVKPKKEASS